MPCAFFPGYKFCFDVRTLLRFKAVSWTRLVFYGFSLNVASWIKFADR